MKYGHKIFFEKKLRNIADNADYILDIGGGRPFQKYLKPYKEWFAHKRYETIDSVADYKPTIVGDAHNLPLKNDSVDAIICCSVLEHLYDPKRAIQEMYRVLKPGGQILAYTHFIYPYHARNGVYSDYFRFTDEGLTNLFSQFKTVELKKQGGYFTALGFFMPFQARFRPIWEPVAYSLDQFFKTEQRSTTAAFYIYGVK
ncbi:MAG: methyltransferase domain-containing protein [Patescibacteria group bacterium]|mgnify:CR=1 FL=1